MTEAPMCPNKAIAKYVFSHSYKEILKTCDFVRRDMAHRCAFHDFAEVAKKMGQPTSPHDNLWIVEMIDKYLPKKQWPWR